MRDALAGKAASNPLTQSIASSDPGSETGLAGNSLSYLRPTVREVRSLDGYDPLEGAPWQA